MKEYQLKLDNKALAFSLLQRPALSDIGLMYSTFIEYDLATIRPYLPRRVENILDIGAGLGGIDIRLAQLYPQSNLYLLDGSEVDAKYGTEISCIYNSQAVTRQFLIDNEIEEHRINTIDYAKNYSIEKDFDLILSLFSWGFHYPLSTYFDLVCDVSCVGTILVVDVRGNEDRQFTQVFNLLASFELFGAERRVYCRK